MRPIVCALVLCLLPASLAHADKASGKSSSLDDALNDTGSASSSDDSATDESKDDTKTTKTEKTEKKPGEWDDDNVEDASGFARSSRFWGLPALALGGCFLGTGMHAMAYGDVLLDASHGGGDSTRDNAYDAGDWSKFGGTISMLVAIPFILAGEIGMGLGAYGDSEVAGLFADANMEDAAAPAWGRLALWESAAHMAAVGAGLGVGGGVVALVATIVAPQVQKKATGPYADEVVSAIESGAGMGMTTLIAGIVVGAVAGGLAGGGWWLDAVVDEMADEGPTGDFKKPKARESRLAPPRAARLAMAW